MLDVKGVLDSLRHAIHWTCSVVQYWFPREISSPCQMRMRSANFQAISLI